MEPLTLQAVMPVIAAIFGCLISIMAGLILAQISQVKEQLKQINSKVQTHTGNSDIHEAGAARTDEQIKNLLKTIEIAHQRMDRVESRHD